MRNKDTDPRIGKTIIRGRRVATVINDYSLHYAFDVFNKARKRRECESM